MGHAKKQGKYGKKQSIKTVPGEVQALDLLNEGFTSAILNIIKELEKTMSQKPKESMRMMSPQI